MTRSHGWCEILLLTALVAACGGDASDGASGPDEGLDAARVEVGSDDLAAADFASGDPDVAAGDTEPDIAPEVVEEVLPLEDVPAEQETVEACSQCSARRPLILVHGINGAPENYDVMAARLEADGWPADWIVRFAAADPAWGCNVDNAAALAELVEQVLADTCQPRVDIVAHSMGTLSSRYYVKNLGGQEWVNTYVTLGGMHHGLFTPCLAPEFLGVCVWRELCESGEFIADLNADPATPGDLHWVSIYGTADADVPNESSHLDGAENIVIEGAEHFGENGLLEREDVYAEVLRVLQYDCW